jgi:hypothetical protein
MEYLTLCHVTNEVQLGTMVLCELRHATKEELLEAVLSVGSVMSLYHEDQRKRLRIDS